MKNFVLLALTGLTLVSASHATDMKSSVNESALKNGEKSAMFCRHCHGDGGNSVRDDTPNLAGQNEVYLATQMNKFATGLRKDEWMEGLIKALTPEERKNIAYYFSQQSVKPKAASTSPQVLAGKRVFEKVCFNCHGLNGHGAEKIPRLAGQHPVYLQNSVKRYRDGTGERIDPLMAAFTRNLTDADIANLAAYISTMN